MPSNVAGYLVPSASNNMPGSLTLTRFIQQMIVGIAGFSANQDLVRPEWQVAPPKQPDISVDWIAFGIRQSSIAGYAAIFPTPGSDTTTMNRQEKLEIQLSFYGPNAFDNITLFRDGLQIQQNNEAMLAANMCYQDNSDPTIGPDLINERWVQRWMMNLTLVRQVVRTYPILSFVSAEGTIHTVVQGNNQEIPFAAEEPEEP